MTNKQYCSKTINSKKVLVWHFLDGSTLKETEGISARNPMCFRAFQNAEVLKVENTKTENHAYINITREEVF